MLSPDAKVEVKSKFSSPAVEHNPNLSDIIKSLQKLSDSAELLRKIIELGHLASTKRLILTNTNLKTNADLKWLYELWPRNLNRENISPTMAVDYLTALSSLIVHYKKLPPLKTAMINDLCLYATDRESSAEKSCEVISNLLDLILTLGVDDLTTLSAVPLEQCLNKIIKTPKLNSALFVETLRKMADIFYWISAEKLPEKISIATLTECLKYLERLDDGSITRALLNIGQIVHIAKYSTAEKAQLHAVIAPLVKRLNKNAHTLHRGDIAHTCQALQLLSYSSHADTQKLRESFKTKWLAYSAAKKLENKGSGKFDKISHLQQFSEYLYASGIIPPTQLPDAWIEEDLAANTPELDKDSPAGKVTLAVTALFSSPQFKGRYVVEPEKLIGIRPVDLCVTDTVTGEIHGFDFDGAYHSPDEDKKRDTQLLQLLGPNGKPILKDITRYPITSGFSSKDTADDIVARVTQPPKVEVKAAPASTLADEVKKTPLVKTTAVAATEQPKEVKKKDSKVQPRAQVSEQDPLDALTDAMRDNNTVAAEKALRKLLEEADQKDTAKANCLLTLLEIGHSNTPNLLSPPSPLIIKLLPLFSRTAISCPISDEAEALSPLTWVVKNNYAALAKTFREKVLPQKQVKKAKRKEKTPTENWWNEEWTKAWKMAKEKEMENPAVFEQLQIAAKQARINLEEILKPKQEIKSASEVKAISALPRIPSVSAFKEEAKSPAPNTRDKNLQAQIRMIQEINVREIDEKSAIIYRANVEKLAQAGLGEAQLTMAHLYFNPKDRILIDAEKFLYWLHLAATNGVKKAQCLLGIAFQGAYSGIEKNPTKSFSWILKAAQSQEDQDDHKPSQYILGCYYFWAYGTTRNKEEAIKWWKLAAREPESVAEAALALGQLYLEKRDFKQAINWLKKAAQNPELRDEAIQLRDEAIFSLSKAYWVQKNFDEGFPYFKEIAEELENANFEKFMLGHCYLEGKGITKDEKEGFKWMQKAAQGIPDIKLAQHQLGLCYLKGAGTAINEKQARIWFAKAAQGPEGIKDATSILQSLNTRGLKKTQLQIGENHLDSKNYAEALAWFTVAAQGPDGLDEAKQMMVVAQLEIVLGQSAEASQSNASSRPASASHQRGEGPLPAISGLLAAIIRSSPAHPSSATPKPDAKKKKPDAKKPDAKKVKTVAIAAPS